jgi:hypothetical protein
MQADVHVTVTTLNASRKRVQIEIVWQDRALAGTQQYREFLTTTIANEALLN